MVIQPDTKLDIAASADAALQFLLRARNWAGWWQEFRLAPGFSDEWVTAYAGTMLASSGDARALEGARAAWALLEGRIRPNGAWGYNALPPGDADSTGWGVQLAVAVGRSETRTAQQALACLQRHVLPGGGVTTYAEDAPIRRFIGLPAGRSLRGWCGAQACVAAAVAQVAELRPRIVPYLRAAQLADGSWTSYWWSDDEYATAFAATALERGARVVDRPRVERAVRWAHGRLAAGGFVATDSQPGGSAFATALCLRTLLLAADPATVHTAVAAATGWLLQQQRPDGSWAPSARLRVPQPDDEHPETYRDWVLGGKIQGSVVFDQRAVFTTSTVLSVLDTRRGL